MKVAPQQPHHMRRRRGLLQGKHSQQSLSALRSSNGAGCSASGCAAAGGASARPHPVQKAADSLSSFPHSGQDRVAGGVLADATGHPAAPPSIVRAEVCSTISDLSGNTATIVCSGSSARIHIHRLIRSALTAASSPAMCPGPSPLPLYARFWLLVDINFNVIPLQPTACTSIIHVLHWVSSTSPVSDL